MEQIYILSLCAFLPFIFISLAFQEYVAEKLEQNKVDVDRSYKGFANLILTLVHGWTYAEELGLRKVMIAWSIVLGITILSGLVALAWLGSIPHPPR